MSKKKYKKQKPSMPYHWWLDADGCWFCKHKNNCSQCKEARKYAKNHMPKKTKGNKPIKDDSYD